MALEKHLGTPAKIFYKDESVSPPGSHKPNTAVAQAWYNKEFGIKRLTTETGAGQWGSALAYAGQLLGIQVDVWMVRVSFDQKPFRKTMMETWGARCVPSPSPETQAGRNILAEMPDTPGSLGIAISEAIEAAVTDPSGTTRYSLGSVLNHVMLHQTIIGLEAKKQLAMAGIKKPDIVIGCAGGGSNFAGLSFPFTADKINGAEIEIIPVEPEACPTLTKAPYAYDHGDTAKMTPLLAMYSLGHAFIPPAIHAGGLRYHGMSPLVSAGARSGLFSPIAYPQLECYEAAVSLCPHRGHHPGARDQPRHRGRHRRGQEGEGRGQGKDHPLQLLGPRSDGSRRLPGLLRRRAPELPAAARGHGALDRGDGGLAEARVGGTMKTTIILALCAALAAPVFAAEPTTALLIIDIQDFYFPGGKMPLVEPEAAAANAGKILAAFRAEGKPVVHVRHDFEPGGSIHASVAPIEGEKVFTKTEVSCFNGTEVLAYLKETRRREAGHRRDADPHVPRSRDPRGARPRLRVHRRR